MKTVTYDETKFVIVPIEPTEWMINSVDQHLGHEIAWGCMLAAAPPYPDQSVEVTDMVLIHASERLP